MRQVRDVLRLNAAGVSGNEIARRVGVAPSAGNGQLSPAAASCFSVSRTVDMTDPVLEGQLLGKCSITRFPRRALQKCAGTVHIHHHSPRTGASVGRL
jgi:hypothetical protein